MRTPTAKFDLTFTLDRGLRRDGRPAGLRGELEYAATCSTGTAAAALRRGLVRVLDAVTAAPDVPVRPVEVLGAARAAGAAGAGHGDAGGCGHGVACRSCSRRRRRRTPDAVAVVSATRTMSLRGAGRAGEPAGAVADRRRGRARSPVAVPAARGRRTWWSRCSGCWRPGRRTCRWTALARRADAVHAGRQRAPSWCSRRPGWRGLDDRCAVCWCWISPRDRGRAGGLADGPVDAAERGDARAGRTWRT